MPNAIREDRCRPTLGEGNAAILAGKFLESVAACPRFRNGPGIVICAGAGKYSVCAWVAIKTLRIVGCRLPIEVWYRGEDEADAAWMALIARLDVECVDAFAIRVVDPDSRLGGWELKPYAILHSRFREVLFLDADNVPVVDPTFLFEEPAYKRTGAVFWPDGFRTPRDSKLWKIFGVSYRDEPDQESGQILIDKERCWEALNLCNWYNQHSEFYYQHVYGDKDTFRFAWHRAGQPFSMPSRGMEMLPFTICQHDFQGRRIFQHRFGDKWSLAGNRRVPEFIHEEMCFEFIAELDRLWCPTDRIIRDLRDSDAEQIEQLKGRRFQYVRIGHNRWSIRLDGRGRIGEGWTKGEFYWWVQSGQLIVANANAEPTARFDLNGNGSWEGVASADQAVALQLIPV